MTARVAAAEGNATLAVAQLSRAPALWRGPAYGEFAYEEFARAEAERLEELRLVALDERAAQKIVADLIREIEDGETTNTAAIYPSRGGSLGLVAPSFDQ